MDTKCVHFLIFLSLLFRYFCLDVGMYRKITFFGSVCVREVLDLFHTSPPNKRQLVLNNISNTLHIVFHPVHIIIFHSMSNNHIRFGDNGQSVPPPTPPRAPPSSRRLTFETGLDGEVLPFAAADLSTRLETSGNI